MKKISSRVFEGRNIYSYKKCIRVDVDLQGYELIPTKDIPGFNEGLLKVLPQLYDHRCGIDEEHGFCIRLEEGTYLAHVCEHMIIALQNMIGIDVAYGKSREIRDSIYYIVFRYEYLNTAFLCVDLAIDIINSLIEFTKINFDERIKYIKSVMSKEEMGVTTREILRAANDRGLPYININNSGMYQIGYGKKGRMISAGIGDKTRCIGVDIACDKYLTKSILYDNFIPVAKGELVNDERELRNKANKIGYPLVIKPQFGSKGKNIFLNIRSYDELLRDFRKVRKITEDILIERYYKGKDYRVCVVGNDVIAVTNRIAPYIIGNGKDSIKELIYKLNQDDKRGYDHEKPMTKVKIDESMIDNLLDVGLTLNSILLKDEVLQLRQNANMSTGAAAIDCTDEISDINKDICIRAAKSIGLDICGIDICAENISGDIRDNGIIVEINAAPGIRMHHYPVCGEKRDVAGAIVSMMYDGNFNNIPVISITGTNGKTTTTRIISYVLSRIGYTVGRTTTSGIKIGDTVIDNNDDTGASSARCILLNKEVDVAVLETARGGIIKRGLGYDLADVAILTNITEDHLGIDGVETMEELCDVKSLVMESIKDSGYAVVNADDEWSLKVLDKIKVPIIFFSKNKDNKYIRNNIDKGIAAVYIKDEAIFVSNRGTEYCIDNLKDIPLTVGGKLEYNIENLMASCAALVALNIDYCIITKCFKEFNIDGKDNKGRFNVFDYDGKSIILDYGHNYNGYKRVIDAIKNISHNRIIGVIGIPGDRSNDSMKRIGRLCSDNMDVIIIKEDKEKRGRDDGEVSRIIEEGVRTGECNDIYIVNDELEALKRAIEISDNGDMIIEFYEKYDELESYLENVLKSSLKLS